ncbi:MAG: hypothetical protein AAF564_17750 [Bacteroidota bacterium]
MAQKVRVWIDTGQSIDSLFEEDFSIEDFGYTKEEWDKLPPQEQLSLLTELCIGFDAGAEFVEDDSKERANETPSDGRDD